MGVTTNIRLLDLKNRVWSNKCIMQYIPPDPIPRGTNLIYDVLQLAKESTITFCNHGINDNTHTFTGVSPTIKETLNNYKLFKQSLAFLQKYNIMFIEQLLLTDGVTLTQWSHLKSKIGARLTGRKPNWFKTIEGKLLSNNITRTVIPEYQIDHSGGNLCNRNYFQSGNRKNTMSIAMDNNRIIFGKEWKKIQIENKKYSILHHHGEVNSVSATTSPSASAWQSPHLNPCTSCILDESQALSLHHNKKGKCHIMVHEDSMIKIPYTKHNNYITKFQVQTTREEIGKHLKSIENWERNVDINRDSQTMITENPLQKRINYIENLFKANEITEILINTYRRNCNGNSIEYSFYTDGSLKKIGMTNTISGIAWLQTIGAAKDTKFKAQIQNWHSSLKAEMLAIFSAILTVPKDSSINIYTDSLSFINKYNTLSKTNDRNNIRKQLKEKYYNLWSIILNYIEDQDLNINFIKVKAHKQDHYNGIVDKLAKEATSSIKLEDNENRKYTQTYNAFWENKSIQRPLRGFIKKIGQANQFAKWVLMNRNLDLWSEINFNKVDWENTWYNIIMADKITKVDLHYKSSFLRTYKIKLLHNELPTLTKLKMRLPKVYTSNKCPRCYLAEEDIQHVWVCPSNTIKIVEIIEKEIQSTATKIKSKNKQTDIRAVKRKIRALPYFNMQNSECNDKEIRLKHILQGLVPVSLNGTIKEFGISNHNSKKIARKLVGKIVIATREKIWIERCTKTIEWEKEIGIQKNLKYGKGKKTNTKRKKLNVNNNNSNKNNNNRDINNDISVINTLSSNIIKNYIEKGMGLENSCGVFLGH